MKGDDASDGDVGAEERGRGMLGRRAFRRG